MSQTRLTEEEIRQAIEDIFVNGENPTQTKVRQRLGRGSYATINKVLKAWREGATIDTSAINLGQVEPMPEEIGKLFERVWATAYISAEQQASSSQIEVLEAENTRLREQLEEYPKLRSEVEGLQSAQRPLIDKVERLSRENTELLRRIDFQREAENLETQAKWQAGVLRAQELEQDNVNLQNQVRRLEEKLSEVGERNLELLERDKRMEELVIELQQQIKILKDENERFRLQLSPAEEAQMRRVREQVEGSVFTDGV